MGEINHNGKTHERLDEAIKEVSKNVKKIETNHLYHLGLALEALKTDVTWLKKFFWIVAGASIGSLIAALFNLL